MSPVAEVCCEEAKQMKSDQLNQTMSVINNQMHTPFFNHNSERKTGREFPRQELQWWHTHQETQPFVRLCMERDCILIQSEINACHKIATRNVRIRSEDWILLLKMLEVGKVQGSGQHKLLQAGMLSGGTNPSDPTWNCSQCCSVWARTVPYQVSKIFQSPQFLGLAPVLLQTGAQALSVPKQPIETKTRRELVRNDRGHCGHHGHKIPSTLWYNTESLLLSRGQPLLLSFPKRRMALNKMGSS